MRTRNGGLRVEQGDLPADLTTEFGEADRIAWDVETTGLDWRQERLATCQLFAEDVGVVVVKTAGSYPGRLAALLEDPAVEKVFHRDLRFPPRPSGRGGNRSGAQCRRSFTQAAGTL